MDAIAVADGEAGEAFVFFVPRRYLLPGLLLESLQSLVKVSDGLCVLFHVLVMDSISLLNGFDERRSELAKLGWVADVKALYNVSCRCRGDGISVGDVEVGDGHEDCCRGAWRSVWRHGDISVGGAEWKGVGGVVA